MDFNSLVSALATAHKQLSADGYAYQQALTAWNNELNSRGLVFNNSSAPRNRLNVKNQTTSTPVPNQTAQDLNTLANNLLTAQTALAISTAAHAAARLAHQTALTKMGAV